MSFYSYFMEAQVMENLRDSKAHPIKKLLGIEANTAIISHYKDIFNAPHQHIQLEKNRQALILAKRTSPFLLPGSKLCQKFNADLFYYAQLALNCPFNCSYCFLQGLYKTGHCVLFINYRDFIQELTELVQKHSSSLLYIPLTHETDLIAFKEGRKLLEHIIPELSQFSFIQFELRTKSAVPDFFKLLPVYSNITYAFSLAPDEIISAYEYKTPPLAARLRAVQACIAKGHSTRLCFDPVFIEPGTMRLYETFFVTIFNEIKPDLIKDISYGFFRMPKKLFRYCASIHEQLYIYHAPYATLGEDITYPAELREKVLTVHRALLERYVPGEKIFILD